MTAINIFLLDGAAAIVTDTRCTDSTGAVYDVSKCLPIPHMRLAVATRGKRAMTGSVARILSVGSKDYDSAKPLLQVRLRDLATVAYLDASERDAWRSEWEIYIVGWSRDRRAPAAFLVVNHDKLGQKPFEVVEIEYMASAPYLPAPVEAARLDPPGNFMALLQAQHDHDPKNIGGFATVTTVHQLGIQQEVIGRLQERQRVKHAELRSAREVAR